MYGEWPSITSHPLDYLSGLCDVLDSIVVFLCHLCLQAQDVVEAVVEEKPQVLQSQGNSPAM